MERYITTLLTVILLASSCLCDKQYRSDYTYNSKTNAFYKFHTESLLNRAAGKACETEGARLMVPSSSLDIVQAHGFLKQFPDLGDLVWIGEDGQHHDSAEEQSTVDVDLVTNDSSPEYLLLTCEVITRNGDIQTTHCYRSLPFICKVNAKDIPYDSHCGVYSNDYEYIETVGSCYNIPRVAYSWNQAYDECDNEGAHLLVINSVLESEVIKNITRSRPAVDRAKYSWFFFAGLRAEKTEDGSPIVFKTIFGQTLKEAGFDQWSENEPNNADGKEYCGSVFKNDGKYNDLDCSHLYAFVCEKEVNK